MFTALERAVDETEVFPDASSLKTVFRLIDRLMAKLSEAVSDFDKHELWDLDHASSMTGWLVHHCGMAHARANSLLIRARRLRELPITAAAWRAGDITDGHIELIIQTVKPRVQHLFAEAEAELIPCLIGLSIVDTTVILREWAARAEATIKDDDGQPELEQVAHFSTLLNGRARLDADLNAESATIVGEALRVARTEDSEAEPSRTPGQRTADALTDLCRYFLDTANTTPGADTTNRRNRPHLNLIIRAEDLFNHTTDPPHTPGTNTYHQPGEANHPEPNHVPPDVHRNTTQHDTQNHPRHNQHDDAHHHEDAQHNDAQHNEGCCERNEAEHHTWRPYGAGTQTTDGIRFDPTTTARQCCDAIIHRVVTKGGSVIIDYGRGVRTVPVAQWNALIIRDRHCRFPGCDRPPKFCEADHVHPWEHGGETNLTNLVMLCVRHHHRKHTPGWHAQLDTDGILHLQAPNGRHHTTYPPDHPDFRLPDVRLPDAQLWLAA